MNRLLWPTELHRHSEVIISSGGAAVKRFWQKTWGGGDSPIDGSESQIVHLRRGPGAGTVEVWRGPCRQPESGHRIREAQVRGRSGGLYTVRFTDTGGGIRVREDRLYPTRDAAAAYVQRRKAERQPIRPGYWHNVPIWQC